MKRCLLFFYAAIILLCSCTRTETVDCVEGRLALRAVGFTSADLQNNVFTSYKPDGRFDSVLYTTAVNTYTVGNDTLELQSALYAEADYVLSLPAIGKEYRITNIKLSGLVKETFTYTEDAFTGPKELYCFNSIRSCDVNGVTFYPVISQYPSYAYQGSEVYIIK